MQYCKKNIYLKSKTSPLIDHLMSFWENKTTVWIGGEQVTVDFFSCKQKSRGCGKIFLWVFLKLRRMAKRKKPLIYKDIGIFIGSIFGFTSVSRKFEVNITLLVQKCWNIFCLDLE